LTKIRIREMVEQAVGQRGFRGIKVHRHEAPATRQAAEAARALRVPVLYDVVGETYRVELIAEQYPDVNFIIPHLGSYADDRRAHVKVVDQIAAADEALVLGHNLLRLIKHARVSARL
jgi:predicted TIM-barrel fold metal-dependent hydrolase